MVSADERKPGWNIFAHVLAGVLAKRGHGLTALYRAGIYREEVRRLRRSLRTPGTFPVLNPQELERIGLYFTLRPDEILALRAAIVTTAVERLLYGRISPDDALFAAYELYPVLANALAHQRVGRVWRHDDDGAPPEDRAASLAADSESDEDLDLPPALEDIAHDILDALDTGALALQFSAASAPIRERVRWATTAKSAYESAQREIAEIARTGDVSAAAGVNDVLAAWTQEAQRGVDASMDRLDELSTLTSVDHDTLAPPSQ